MATTHYKYKKLFIPFLTTYYFFENLLVILTIGDSNRIK